MNETKGDEFKIRNFEQLDKFEGYSLHHNFTTATDQKLSMLFTIQRAVNFASNPGSTTSQLENIFMRWKERSW